MPCPVWNSSGPNLPCLMFFCLPDLYIKYITAFFNFLQLCVPQKTKNASFCRFVSSRLVFVSSGPLAALVSLFYYIPNSDLRFFLQRGYEFLLSSEPQIGFNMKKRRNPSTNFVGLCVCVCTEFSFFLVAAALWLLSPRTHSHTHTLSPSVQHLSLSQNSRCISESHLKFCFFLLCVFLFLFFLIFAWANYAFCISYFEYLSFVSVVSFGRNNWGKTRQAEGGGERKREDKSAFLSL